MTWKIVIADNAKKQLSKLDYQTKSKILNFLNQNTIHNSPKSSGKSLVGKLKGLWRYRVGDYRIICELKNKELTLLVINVGHRKEIYKRK